MSSNEVSTDGHIEVITGSMFSGKTEELIRRLERAEIAGNNIRVFKPSVDNRYDEEKIGSHKGSKWDAEVIDPEGLEKAFSDIDSDVVAIDEANFFDEKLVGHCQRMANNGKRVIVSGTDQTFRGEPFKPLPKLIVFAEYVEKLRAVCSKCGNPATRNQRLIDGEPASKDSPTILVGGEEKYEPRCRHCHELKE